MPTSRSRRLLALLAVTAAQTATAAAADPCASMAFPYTLAGADNAERVANLRQAIICANTNTTADVIDLGGHTLAFDDGPYIAGDDSANALPVVTGGLTLKNGELRRSEAAVAAPAEFRFLYYLPVQANSSQIIEGVTFRHGVAAVGGAIMSFEGKLEVLDSTFIGNQAHELGYGGAIYARDRLDLRGSLLQGNEAVSGGGAVNGAAVEVRDTRFENNTTGHFGGG